MFSVRLDVGFPSPVDVPVTAYSAAALQMVNDIALGPTYRTCMNETCGRTFTRQRDRAQYGQHRISGLRYCSRSCARAQGERERRRRARQEKG